MLAQLVTGLFAICGLGLIVAGIHKCSVDSDVSRVVASFVEAILRGEHDVSLTYVGPELRSHMERSDSSDSFHWGPSPGFRYHIEQVDVQEPTARVRVRIKQDEFVIVPTVHLQNVNGEWRITRIESESFHSVTEGRMETLSRNSGEQIAEELEQAFDSIAPRPAERVSSLEQNAKSLR